MAKKIESYEGRPVFVASNSEKLAEAVAKYDGEVQPPYVVRLPSQLKEVKKEAFYHDETVGVVLMPDSITRIGTSAFEGCKNLSHVTFPDSLAIIDDYAFMDCSSIEVLHIPDSLVSCGYWGFKDCTSLKEIHIKNPDLLAGQGLDGKIVCFHRKIKIEMLPEHILKLPLLYFTYEDDKMAFAVSRHFTNYVIERLLALNLTCFGDYAIVGYGKLLHGDNPQGANPLYDVYHTNLPKEHFLEVVKEELDINQLECDEYSQWYDDIF